VGRGSRKSHAADLTKGRPCGRASPGAGRAERRAGEGSRGRGPASADQRSLSEGRVGFQGRSHSRTAVGDRGEHYRPPPRGGSRANLQYFMNKCDARNKKTYETPIVTTNDTNPKQKHKNIRYETAEAMKVNFKRFVCSSGAEGARASWCRYRHALIIAVAPDS